MTLTLHERVEDDILDRIQTGDWQVGDRLPPEKDLAAQLGISRSTLRLAFDGLERKGDLERKSAPARILFQTARNRVSRW